ncbi:MAG: hypothetical protein WCF96_08480 [Eubacteriales bacterium]
MDKGFTNITNIKDHSKRKFSVIKGGNTTIKGHKTRKFVSAYVTDTRLMGVVGLYLKWDIIDALGTTEFHQFFYLDSEEYGFESYRSLFGNDEFSLEIMEQTTIGGLGGKKIQISEREARYLFQHFSEMNQRLGLPWPEEKSEYSFLLQPKILLSPMEKQELVDRMCTKIQSDYQIIHYFLMRIFGNDKEGASYLMPPSLFLEEDLNSAMEKFGFYTNKKESTLCKNTIDRFEDETGISYLCESLIETFGYYYLYVTEIRLTSSFDKQLSDRDTSHEKIYIKSAREISSFKVSPAETAMMLNRPEYITLFEIAAEQEEFEPLFLPFMAGNMMTPQEGGKLFIEFKKNNDHVNQKVFTLNDDIQCLYYFSEYGQLILSAFSLPEISLAEKKLKSCAAYPLLIVSEKFEFKEPILYEFIQSGFDDFVDFLDSIE